MSHPFICFFYQLFWKHSYIFIFRSSCIRCPPVLTFGHIHDGMNVSAKHAVRSTRTVPYTTHMLKASVCEPLELKACSACTWGRTTKPSSCCWLPAFYQFTAAHCWDNSPLLCIPRDSHSSLPEIRLLQVAPQIK